MITWRQWLIGALALSWVGYLTPLLAFAEVIVWCLAVGAYAMAFTGGIIRDGANPEQKRGEWQ